MGFNLTEILGIISIGFILFCILQQQKIKAMKEMLSTLEDELEDKLMIIRALTSHVNPSESDVPEGELINFDIDNDAEPMFDDLNIDRVLNWAMETNIIPNEEKQFYISWYFPSKEIFENKPPEITLNPWFKKFLFTKTGDNIYSVSFIESEKR